MKELSNEELEKVTGGNKPIEDYIADTHYCKSFSATAYAREAGVDQCCRWCIYFGGNFPNCYCKIDQTPNLAF